MAIHNLRVLSRSLYTYGRSKYGQLGYGDCQDQAILSHINLNCWALMSFFSCHGKSACLEESVQWIEMVTTTSEKVIGNIATLFTVGDTRKGKSNDGGGERVDEEYGTGRRKLKGKLHWGCVRSMNQDGDNLQQKEKRKGVILKKAKGKKIEKKTDWVRSGSSRGTSNEGQNVLGEDREKEPSLRDILTAIVFMEKRNNKMRMEVTKLRIALNAQTRLLNSYMLRSRLGKRWYKNKKHSTENNSMPSFDLGFESEEKKDATENDVDDGVWDEDIIRDAEIGTQQCECEDDFHDSLTEISTQEVEGWWLKAVDGLGLRIHADKLDDKDKCEKGSTYMVKDVLQLDDGGKDMGVEDVLPTDVDGKKQHHQRNEKWMLVL
ncbi:hypothetical protein DM860_011063 [Cuscuta australis]|uniref:Uncharacterized protein n=1 Tax=Cuscuta australis TaxID=267555 RepID=A0A328E554_9ASTE|nr:hypothetical protein DM860_011063 [Cuscuta australis]